MRPRVGALWLSLGQSGQPSKLSVTGDQAQDVRATPQGTERGLVGLASVDLDPAEGASADSIRV